MGDSLPQEMSEEVIEQSAELPNAQCEDLTKVLGFEGFQKKFEEDPGNEVGNKTVRITPPRTRHYVAFIIHNFFTRPPTKSCEEENRKLLNKPIRDELERITGHGMHVASLYSSHFIELFEKGSEPYDPSKIDFTYGEDDELQDRGRLLYRLTQNDNYLEFSCKEGLNYSMHSKKVSEDKVKSFFDQASKMPWAPVRTSSRKLESITDKMHLGFSSNYAFCDWRIMGHVASLSVETVVPIIFDIKYLCKKLDIVLELEQYKDWATKFRNQ